MTQITPLAETHAFALPFDASWFEAPGERSPQFFPAYMRISVAMQTLLRQAIPETHLADLEQFRDTRMAYPLLVYAASRPFAGQPRTDFTYDILNKTLMRKFYYSVGQNLPVLLAEVAERLRAAGMDDVAAEYRPDRARRIVDLVVKLQITRRRLEALLVAETLLVNDLIAFAGSGTANAKARTKLAAECGKSWTSKLSRLYAKQDYSWLAPALLAAATDALAGSLDHSAQQQAA